jgi:hypothetical protein
MRTSSDRFPIVLTLAAFVLMFLGQASYERLVDALIVGRLAPWLSAAEAQVVERFSAVAVRRDIPLRHRRALLLPAAGIRPAIRPHGGCIKQAGRASSRPA